jgi:predicted metal-dependent HD superfamily phosphohydrolase
METKIKEYAQQLRMIDRIAREVMPNLPYHNYNHLRDVENEVSRLAKHANLSYEERFVLRTAGKLHDIVQVVGAKDNEEKTAELSEKILANLNYSPEQIRLVKVLIMATKMPQKPNSYLEKVICDADLANLGRPDFAEKGELFRTEMGIPSSRKFYETQYNFLYSHRYHTEIARTRLDSGKEKNLRLLNEKLGGMK